MAIKAQTYTFHCTFETEARLSGYIGSILRGALSWALKKTSCALRHQHCEDCILHKQCIYAWIFKEKKYLFKPITGNNTRPHPFLFKFNNTHYGRQQRNDPFEFSLTLFDRCNDFLPQIVHAVQIMGESGIGTGRKYGLGKFKLDKVETADNTIYDLKNPVLNITSKTNNLELNNDSKNEIKKIQIKLLTPLRLKLAEKLDNTLPFHLLIRAALRRISSLENAYGSGEPKLDYKGLVKRAEKISITDSKIHWLNLYRWSNLQRKRVPLSGLKGSICYKGNLQDFLPLLQYCEQANIGKQTIFGLGSIKVIPILTA